MIKEEVRASTISDIPYIVENVRASDVAELDALDGSTIGDSLKPELVPVSQTWEVDGKPICMFGVTPHPNEQGVGIIWMLATKHFDKYSKMFAVRCQKVVKQMIKNYEYVFNYVHSENVTSIKWLSWLGFTIGEPEPIGHKGANFTRFEIINV